MEAIVAVDKHWGIGKNGNQPIYIKKDLQRFAKITTGRSVVFGRKTMETFPEGKPLKGRNNYMLSTSVIHAENLTVCHDMEELFEKAPEDAIVIGGASAYKELFPYIDKVYVTKIDADIKADCFFPNLDNDKEWRKTECTTKMTEDGVGFTFEVYERVVKKGLSPVLKWAGGKTQLLPIIKKNLPSQFNRYFEPFVGAGAVLLNIQPQEAFINDINPQLINIYKVLKDNPTGLIERIREMDAGTQDEKQYYTMRDWYNDKILCHSLDEECAAMMIWLNKHCFNGLYRVNANGEFNVPFNNRSAGKSIDEENAMAISRYLNEARVVISNIDFEDATAWAKEGDFVYFDSPYVPETETASFTAYAKNGFGRGDHERLAALFRKLDTRGVKLMLSNNDVPFVRELYEGFRIQSFPAKRMINRDAEKRVGREVIITNY